MTYHQVPVQTDGRSAVLVGGTHADYGGGARPATRHPQHRLQEDQQQQRQTQRYSAQPKGRLPRLTLFISFCILFLYVFILLYFLFYLVWYLKALQFSGLPLFVYFNLYGCILSVLISGEVRENLNN